MINPYIPKLAKVKKIFQETPDIKRFTFEFVDKKDRAAFAFSHGQFLMLGLPNFGEAAFDICSSAQKTDTFDLAIRNAGALTSRLHQLKSGDLAQVRGPFGHGLLQKAYKDKELLLIGGGTGFIVFRSFILDYLAGKLPVGKLNVFYGCVSEANLLFCKEFKAWQKKIGLDIALAAPEKNWPGAKGLVTTLFKPAQDFSQTVALVVGPPIMYRPVIAELIKRGMKESEIYVSLERRMYCGIGVCQHCAIGPYYVCKDGPVFCWEQLKDIPGAV